MQDARTITGTRLVLTYASTPALCQRKKCHLLGSGVCVVPWNMELNETYLNYFGNKEHREESSNDYSLVIILHAFVNWLSRTTATRIWVVNADMKTWGNIKSLAAEDFHSLLCVTVSSAETLGSKQNGWRLPLLRKMPILNHD